MTIRTQPLKKIISHDLYYALRSPRGVLFLVFFAVFWLWIFSKFGQVNTQWLKSPDSAMMLTWFFDRETAQALFSDHHPSFSLFYLIAIYTAPFFVLFAASDQTANDIGSKYLRFLLPRCNRSEIYLGRFLGCVLLVWSAYFVISVIALLWVVLINGAEFGPVFVDWLWVVVSLAIYVLPFIALMSLCSALVGSAGLSALLGLGFYFIITIIVSVLGFQSGQLADIVALILPNATKSWLLQFDVWQLLKALMVSLVYLVIYGWSGWWLFSRRDI